MWWGRFGVPASTACARALGSRTRWRAGGSTRGADLAALNLAAPLVDGIQVLVPARVRVAGIAPSGDADVTAPDLAAAGLGAKVSLGAATADELDEASPGWGQSPRRRSSTIAPSTDHSRSVDELDAVPESARPVSSSCATS